MRPSCLPACQMHPPGWTRRNYKADNCRIIIPSGPGKHPRLKGREMQKQTEGPNGDGRQHGAPQHPAAPAAPAAPADEDSETSRKPPPHPPTVTTLLCGISSLRTSSHNDNVYIAASSLLCYPLVLSLELAARILSQDTIQIRRAQPNFGNFEKSFQRGEGGWWGGSL